MLAKMEKAEKSLSPLTGGGGAPPCARKVHRTAVRSAMPAETWQHEKQAKWIAGMGLIRCVKSFTKLGRVRYEEVRWPLRVAPIQD